MSKTRLVVGSRRVARFAFAGMAAASLAACADSGRLGGDPLGNPYATASLDRSHADPNHDLMPRRQPPASAITAKPLPAPEQTGSLPPRGSADRYANYAAPAHASPRLVEPVPAVHAETPTASIASGHGSWSPNGGMPVIAAQGESAHILAERYNVPEDTLLRANGFGSAAQVRPGTRVVIPVYSAAGAPAPKPSEHVAERAPVHAAPEHPAPEHVAALHHPEPAEHEAAKPEAVKPEHGKSDHAKLDRAKLDQAERDRAEHEKLAARREQKPERVAKAAPKPEAEPREHGHARADEKMARAEKEKSEHAMKAAKAEAPRKAVVAEAEPVKAPAPKTPAAKALSAKTPVVKPLMMAKAAPEETRKPAPPVDATPTASLPPPTPVSAAANPEFRWPARGRIIQGFKSGGNDGINIAVPEGTAVKAAESGVVAYAGSEIKGFGNLVLIRHPNGYVSAYANNGELDVKRGEQVKRGQVIAKSGQSGNVASPQLHFELRKGSTPVDPTQYLAGL